MANSTTGSAAAKPHPDFPLTPRGDGRWCKRIKGKLHYFRGSAAEALDEWLRTKDYLIAGRKPPPKDDDSVTLADVINSFLEFKESLKESGELAPRTFERYEAAGKMLAAFFGRNRRADDLTPDDFLRLRSDMAKRWGPVALSNEIQMVRSIFRYGYEAGLLDKPVRFGPGFKKPSAKTLRLERAKSGPKMFTPEQIKDLLAAASPNMAAASLLGVNCGYGPSDIAHLTISAIDLESGWATYPRPKTGIERRCKLWPETIATLEKVLVSRPEPRDREHRALFFLRPDGTAYIGGKLLIDKVTRDFRTLMSRAKVTGRSFYDLRRTLQTIGEGAHDLVAVQSIMGHAPASSDMSSIYRQRIDDERLQAVTEHVRRWLFAKPAKQAKGKGGAK